jgi:hypothetical protein
MNNGGPNAEPWTTLAEIGKGEEMTDWYLVE